MAKQTFTTGQVLSAAQMTSLQQTAMGGGSTTAKTASYVLVATDAGTVVQMDSASATTITVNTALFAAGDSVQIMNIGAGVCTVTAGTATVTTAGTVALAQWAGGELYFSSASASIFRGATASGGGMTQLATGTLSGSTTVISSLSGSYRNLQIVVRGYRSTVDGVNLRVRFNNDSTNSYVSNPGFTSDNSAVFASSFALTLGSAADNATTTSLGVATIWDYANTTTWKFGTTFGITPNSTTPANVNFVSGNGAWNNLSAITGITFWDADGTFQSGTYFIYGVN